MQNSGVNPDLPLSCLKIAVLVQCRFGRHLKSVGIVNCYLDDLHSHIEDNSADFVVCTYVLCSVKDVASSLTSIHRILKPVRTNQIIVQ